MPSGKVNVQESIGSISFPKETPVASGNAPFVGGGFGFRTAAFDSTLFRNGVNPSGRSDSETSYGMSSLWYKVLPQIFVSPFFLSDPPDAVATAEATERSTASSSEHVSVWFGKRGRERVRVYLFKGFKGFRAYRKHVFQRTNREKREPQIAQTIKFVFQRDVTPLHVSVKYPHWQMFASVKNTKRPRHA